MSSGRPCSPAPSPDGLGVHLAVAQAGLGKVLARASPGDCSGPCGSARALLILPCAPATMRRACTSSARCRLSTRASQRRRRNPALLGACASRKRRPGSTPCSHWAACRPVVAARALRRARGDAEVHRCPAFDQTNVVAQRGGRFTRALHLELGAPGVARRRRVRIARVSIDLAVAWRGAATLPAFAHTAAAPSGCPIAPRASA